MTLPTDQLERLAVDTIRTLSIDGVQQANSGHPGAPMGMAPMTFALWTKHLRHAPTDPAWPNRDRFVLSAGHASMLLYSMLHLTGYAVSMDDLKSFRQWGSITPGHPEYGMTPGVEATTGPLGQGLRQRRGHGHRGAPPRGRVQPARPRGHRPPDVRHLLRRRPPGGHHGRGRIAGGPPQARQADRALRRQPDPARRPHRLDVHRGRRRPLRRLRLAHPAGRRRQRRRRDQRRHRGRQGGRPALAHRRPHHDRLREPQQGRLAEGARRPARPRRGPPHQGGLRLGPGQDVLRAGGGRRAVPARRGRGQGRAGGMGCRRSTPTPPPTPPRPPSCAAASPGAWRTAGTPGSTSTRPDPRWRPATRART